MRGAAMFERRRALGRRMVLPLLLAVAVILASCFRTQAPVNHAANPAAPPTPIAQLGEDAGYVGAETCKGCHEDAFNRFGTTKMGKLFLLHPRSVSEHTGCEACHGPGKAHVDAGGGKGKDAKLITFAKDDPTPAEVRNQRCLTCHTKGARLFWAGSPHAGRDVGCTSCHRLMQNNSPKFQLAKATEVETCGTCHI